MTQTKVNADNFAVAETHRMMADLQRDAGGVNRFSHNPEPAPIDKQTVIRLNRDTLYSFAVVDISAGATAPATRCCAWPPSRRPSSAASVGSRQDDVYPVHHLIGTAAGWGGLPDTEATYIGVSPGLPVGEDYLTINDDVPVDGFWSISVYNAEGFFEPDDQGAYSVNNITAARDDDGSVTVRFGGIGDNSIPITEGWNYLVRRYRPRAESLSGAWTFPRSPPSPPPSHRHQRPVQSRSKRPEDPAGDRATKLATLFAQEEGKVSDRRQA